MEFVKYNGGLMFQCVSVPFCGIIDNVFRNNLIFHFISDDVVVIICLPQRIVFVEFSYCLIVRINSIIDSVYCCRFETRHK